MTKVTKNKTFVLQTKASNTWWFVAEEPSKVEAVSLLKYKRNAHKESKWRLVQRTITDKPISVK